MGSARARKPDLTPEEAKNWRLAKLFDLRSFIGALLLIFGVLVIIPGVRREQGDDRQVGRDQPGAVDRRDSCWSLGAFFLTWILLKPPPPVTTAEAEASRKAREEFGTQGPAGH